MASDSERGVNFREMAEKLYLQIDLDHGEFPTLEDIESALRAAYSQGVEDAKNTAMCCFHNLYDGEDLLAKKIAIEQWKDMESLKPPSEK